MKVGIVGFANLMVVPYIKTYTDILKEQNIEYDIITWDRFLMDESEDGCSNLYVFHKKFGDDESIVKKIYPMLSYAGFVKRALSREKYDKLIILYRIG